MMKKTTVFKRFAALTAAFVLILAACKKQDLTVEEKLPLPVKEKLQLLQGYYVANEKTPLKPSDKDGNWLTEAQIEDLKKGAMTEMLCAPDVDPSTRPDPVFKGHSVSLQMCAPTSPSTTTVQIIFSYTMDLPASLILSASNKATIKIAAAGYPFTTDKIVVVSPSFSATGPVYYNSEYGVDMKPYSVAFSTTIPYQEYCIRNTYLTKIVIYTDCAAIPYVSTGYQTTGVPFTPNTYQTYGYSASYIAPDPVISGDPKKIKAEADVLPCTWPCHAPSLGSSTEHIFEFRKSGTTYWDSKTFTDLLPHNIIEIKSSAIATPIALSAGVYEYRSKGKLNTTGTYSPYSAIQTVTIP